MKARVGNPFGLMQIPKNAKFVKLKWQKTQLNSFYYQPKGLPSSKDNFSGSGGTLQTHSRVMKTGFSLLVSYSTLYGTAVQLPCTGQQSATRTWRTLNQSKVYFHVQSPNVVLCSILVVNMHITHIYYFCIRGNRFKGCSTVLVVFLKKFFFNCNILTLFLKLFNIKDQINANVLRFFAKFVKSLDLAVEILESNKLASQDL